MLLSLSVGDVIIGDTGTPALISLILRRENQIYVTSVAQAFAEYITDSETGLTHLRMPPKSRRSVRLRTSTGDVQLGHIIKLRFNYQEDICLIQVTADVEVADAQPLLRGVLHFVKPVKSALYDHFQLVTKIGGRLEMTSVTMFHPTFDTVGVDLHMAVELPREIEDQLMQTDEVRVGLLLVRDNQDGSYSPAGQLRFKERTHRGMLWVFSAFYNSMSLVSLFGLFERYQIVSGGRQVSIN